MPDEYLLADTSVLSHLSKESQHSDAYNAMIGSRRLAVSFQTPAELRAAGFKAKRQQRVDDLLATTVKLPHAESTDIWYAMVVEIRKERRTKQLAGADASDADVWIISGALEHRLDLLSHDKQQVMLGRAAGLRVYTNLPDLKDDNP